MEKLSPGAHPMSCIFHSRSTCFPISSSGVGFTHTHTHEKTFPNIITTTEIKCRRLSCAPSLPEAGESGTLEPSEKRYVGLGVLLYAYCSGSSSMLVAGRKVLFRNSISTTASMQRNQHPQKASKVSPFPNNDTA